MNFTRLRNEVLGCSCLLLVLLFAQLGGLRAQTNSSKPSQPSHAAVYQPNYAVLPDTTADWWIEHHIAISSRHYIGLEVGFTHAWMSGAQNFFFQFQPTPNAMQTRLPFQTLGFGEGAQIGAVGDWSLSDHFGLQGKVRYFNNVTKSSGTGTQWVTDATGASSLENVTSSYSLVQNYIGADALARFQLVPQKYYVLGGVSAAVPVTQSFTTSTLIAPIGVAHPAPYSASMNAPISDNFFNNFRLDARVGVGTFFPVNDDMVVTPELMLTIPGTSPFAKGTQDFYRSQGALTPRLWYVTASVSVKFQNGGFSLFAEEKEKQKAYEQELKMAARLHPMPTLKHFSFTPTAIAVKQQEFPRDTLPDYEVDSEGRLVRWEDLGPNADKKLRLVAFFETAKATILDISFPDLDRLAMVMHKHKELDVEIAAYTDSRGSYKKNVKLSEDRANSVKDYLIHKGIEPERLPAHGYGPDHPVASNDTPGGRASNRRVEFVVVRPSAAVVTPPAETKEGQ
jgi:outer membrane protein OmpA-like peptidoglycan-associated protein